MEKVAKRYPEQKVYVVWDNLVAQVVEQFPWTLTPIA